MKSIAIDCLRRTRTAGGCSVADASPSAWDKRSAGQPVTANGISIISIATVGRVGGLSDSVANCHCRKSDGPDSNRWSRDNSISRPGDTGEGWPEGQTATPKRQVRHKSIDPSTAMAAVTRTSPPTAACVAVQLAPPRKRRHFAPAAIALRPPLGSGASRRIVG